MRVAVLAFVFFFNDTATTEIYTLSLHDALPICTRPSTAATTGIPRCTCTGCWCRSEEHTSELQSRGHLVCRLLLETKKKNSQKMTPINTSLHEHHPLFTKNAT